MKTTLRFMLFGVAGVTAGVFASAACSSSGGGSADNFAGNGGAAATGGAGGNSANGGSGAISVIDAGNLDAALNEDSACAEQSAEATLVKKPVDIIFVIDNSCSMSTENKAVENNVNQNFASIIQASGVDYRVIMLTSYTSGYEVQVGPPLGISTGGSAPQLNPPIFYHYNRTVSSHNSLCVLLDTYDVADTHNLSNGWKDWLRTDALKTFVEITDDGTSCSSSKSGNNYSDGNNEASGIIAGDKWDADLLALDPTQFGTAADRNYIFHSILGMKGNTPSTKAYEPTDPFVIPECPTGVDPGTAYQQLSKKTGGLRFPVCEGSGFDAVFQKIAEGVIKGAQVACELDIPKPPPGEEIDLKSIRMKYTPSGGGADIIIERPDLNSCKANAFYIEADKLKLCPAACATIQADDAAKLQTLFGCTSGIPA